MRHSEYALALWLALVSLPASGTQALRGAQAAAMSPAEQEAFLLHAKIVSERRTPGRKYAWRVTLDDGTREHNAAVETEDGTTPTRRNCRFNVAAYELDKILELQLVAPSVIRLVDGTPAALTWWVDDTVMAERDRRAKNIEPPDARRWDDYIQAVRVFDELTANRYRNVKSARPVAAPDESGPQQSYEWGELLIMADWRIRLIDHTATFGTRKSLDHPESLARCERGLLRKLRALNRAAFQQALAAYLSAERVDALEARRALLVAHFDELIARKGERAVLYDLPPRR